MYNNSNVKLKKHQQKQKKKQDLKCLIFKLLCPKRRHLRVLFSLKKGQLRSLAQNRHNKAQTRSVQKINYWIKK